MGRRRCAHRWPPSQRAPPASAALPGALAGPATQAVALRPNPAEAFALISSSLIPSWIDHPQTVCSLCATFATSIYSPSLGGRPWTAATPLAAPRPARARARASAPVAVGSSETLNRSPSTVRPSTIFPLSIWSYMSQARWRRSPRVTQVGLGLWRVHGKCTYW